MLKGKDLLSIHDLSVDEVNEILELGHELKAKQKAGIEHHLLKGKTLGMIFEKRRVVPWTSARCISTPGWRWPPWRG